MGLEKIKMSVIEKGIQLIMNARRVDPHIVWLKSLKWDNVNRIDKFFSHYVGIPSDEYVDAVSKNFWISLVARGMDPGCKFDSMVVLEGHEGIRKSSLVQAIGGVYTFNPSTTHLMDDTDELRKMHQSIIVELPELMGLVKQDSNKVKAFMSKSFDHIRELYSRKALKKNRGFVFMGTTNNDRYLAHDMGARRFWPLKVPAHIKTIELEKVKEDREQLFAEALVRYKKGEKFYEVPSILHGKSIGSRVNIESITKPIQSLLPTMGTIFDTADIFVRLNMQGIMPAGLTEQAAKRIHTALLSLGATEIETPEGFRWHYSPIKETSLDSFI